MTTPPGATYGTFDRNGSYAMSEQQGGGSQPASRRNSSVQNIDSVSANNAGLDVQQFTNHTQSAPWDTTDFTSARNTSPGFSYTPSYRESFTPYGSDSGVSWPGPDAGSNQLYDEPSDAHDVEYNPADFDGPPTHSNVGSPYYIDQDLTLGGGQGLQSEYMSNSRGLSVDSTGNVPSSDHYSSHSRNLSADQSQFAHSGYSMDPSHFSPRPFSVPSPASSVGLPQDHERPRSRASSVSSVNRAPTPSLTVGPMGEAFDKLVFDSVDTDLMWRNQQQQQLNQVSKAPSPPQLLIPGESSSSLQIPSFGNNMPSLSVDGAGNGALGLAAPGINILPATPVSGGAGAAHVPFQHVLQTLNEQRQSQTSAEENMGMINSHGNSTFSPQPPSRPSTPGQAQTTSFNFNFPSNPPVPSPFQFPPAGSTNNNSTAPALDNFLAFPGLTQPNNPRPRALSETSIRPVMTTMDPMMPNLGGSHPSISPAHFSPSLTAHAPPVSSMGRTMANHRSNSFGSSDSISLHFNPNQQATFSEEGGLGADLRRGRPDNRHRPSRSEDFGRASPFQPATNLLAPSSAYSYAPSVRSQDPMGTSMPSGVGPTRHGRRMSGSPHAERSGSASSVRASPYPSPSGSPALVPQGLPGSDGMLTGVGPDGNPWGRVERQQVTTPATAKASEGRRKGEASFVCPVPGCGSTFTRHFNLKGHLRSHNEERPFKCKWPGCEKGFARQHDCKRHEALHLNLRPYTCDGCKKTFARMDALNRHLKSEGGVDCARAQGTDDAATLFGMGAGLPKSEDPHGWPIMNARASGTLAM